MRGARALRLVVALSLGGGRVRPDRSDRKSALHCADRSLHTQRDDDPSAFARTCLRELSRRLVRPSPAPSRALSARLRASSVSSSACFRASSAASRSSSVMPGSSTTTSLPVSSSGGGASEGPTSTGTVSAGSGFWSGAPPSAEIPMMVAIATAAAASAPPTMATSRVVDDRDSAARSRPAGAEQAVNRRRRPGQRESRR